MENREFHPLTPEEIEEAFRSDNTAEIRATLVTLALYDSHWQQVQGYCLLLG